MLGLLKSKNPYEQNAKAIYGQCLIAARKPIFYEQYALPDTFDGRFDLLLLHVFLVIETVLENAPNDAETYNQALFDSVFADMDQTLREMGIGDMGIPKHMRKMMKAFNGRMHAYSQAVRENSLHEALRKNLYGTLDDAPEQAISMMKRYIEKMLIELSSKENVNALLSGAYVFPDVSVEKE